LLEFTANYIQKTGKKGRTKTEVDEIFFWLTRYNEKSLKQYIDSKTNFEDFFANLLKLTQNLCNV
jgi:hypothetical protein